MKKQFLVKTGEPKSDEKCFEAGSTKNKIPANQLFAGIRCVLSRTEIIFSSPYEIRTVGQMPYGCSISAS